MAHELQRGAIPVDLDRPRVLFFALDATELLIQRYGVDFNAALYSAKRVDGVVNLELKSLKAMAYFIWAGCQWQLAEGETFTLAQVEEQMVPFKVKDLFGRLTMALTGAHATPEIPPGKGPAAAEAAQSQRRRRNSTSTRLSASPSASSDGA